MTKKVNFSALEIQGIDGSKQRVDVQDEIANLIYMRGQNIQQCELGCRLYQAGRKDGLLDPKASREVEMSYEELSLVRNIVQQFPLVVREALLKQIDQ